MADKFDGADGADEFDELDEFDENEDIFDDEDGVSYAEEVVYGDSKEDVLVNRIEDDDGIKEINLADYAKDIGNNSIIETLKNENRKKNKTKNTAVKKLWQMADIEQAAAELAKGFSKPKHDRKTELRKMSYMPVHILAFMIPFALMMAAFASIGLYPFGDQQIMIIDSWHQYYPFLQELQSKLLNFESILYSWNGGGGTNFLTLMGYYASTPLYLLSVLCPPEYLREFMMVITAVKIALAGLFFSIYLRGVYNHDYLNKTGDLVYNKKHCTASVGLAITGFSVLYALCAYTAGYYWCIFFLDNVALLPLIMLGLERLIDSGKFKLYAVTLGLAALANHYTALFVCFFTLVYYFVIYFIKLNKKFSFTGFVKKSFQVLATSLIGLGLAGCILLPIYNWFGNTGNSASEFNRDTDTYTSLIDIFTNLLTGTEPTIRAMPPEGLPNIAAGVACIIFAGLYFINVNIRIRERLLYGGLLVFLALGFNLNILDYFWHAGRFPHEIPFRQSFVFSFVLVSIAFKSYIAFKSNRKSVSPKALGLFGLLFFAYILFAEKLYKNTGKFGFEVFYISGALLAVYMIVLMLFKYKKIRANMLAVFLMFVMFFEGGISSVKGAATAGSSGRSSYPLAAEAFGDVIDYIHENDTDFYRLELARWFGTNEPMLYGYRGISQFSSTANGRFTRILEILGIKAHPGGGNKYLYSSATPVANMFLNLKYLMTRSGHSHLNSIAFDKYYEYYADEYEAYESAEVTAYINKYWLPAAFMISENVNYADLSAANPFIVQNDIMKKASGIRGDIFRSIEPEYENRDINVNVTPAEYGTYHYSVINTGNKGTVNKRFAVNSEQQVYLYLKNPWHGGDKDAVVRIYSPNGGVLPGEVKAEADNGVTIDCGIVPAGGEVEISFEVHAGSARFYLYAAGFDAALFEEGYNILNESVMQVSEFSATKIKGEITVYEDGLFFASIPYDKGWRVRVNGVPRVINPPSEIERRNAYLARERGEKPPEEDPQAIKTFRDGFITLPLEAGSHEIEFYYVTDGLIPGIILSLICIALLIEWDFISKIYTRKKKKQETAVY
ncbi:MAG: YfhO family protein [Oscillospiraceae bacterium]|nr:YfhO family protein [Oscillospiraceae bacterium]